MSSADNLCKQFGPRSGSRLFDSDGIHEILFWKKVDFEKSADNKKKNMQNYPVGKVLIKKITPLERVEIRSSYSVHYP